ncbi:hypothetical protein PIB30_040245 [Stylosanthes scabra]|uniref:Uncharacterized protein n=1 Tax=Stylosanthes scabra TaxID=79078 RepID=A0ABU6VGP2_9FABA|nr:hypothetical protein [Stylosanthes scabra]
MVGGGHQNPDRIIETEVASFNGEEPRSLLPDEAKAQSLRASTEMGWGVYLQGTPMPKSVMWGNCSWSGLSGFPEDVTPPCVAPSRVSSRGVSEVDTVPCQLHRSASELRGCPTSRNSSYTGREAVLRGLGLQSWAYWAGMNRLLEHLLDRAKAGRVPAGLFRPL